MPEVCITKALVQAFRRKRFTLCHKFHANEDTRQYWIRFPDIQTLPCRIPIDQCASSAVGERRASLVLKPFDWDACDICGGAMEDAPRCYESMVQPIRHRDLCHTLKVPAMRREVELSHQ
jgi:hypothetical protein